MRLKLERYFLAQGFFFLASWLTISLPWCRFSLLSLAGPSLTAAVPSPVCEGKQTCFSLAKSRSLSAAAPRQLSSPCSAWWGFPAEYRQGDSGGENPYNCPEINSPPLQKRARNWWCLVVFLPQNNGSCVTTMPILIVIKKTLLLVPMRACACLCEWRSLPSY